MGTTRRKGLQRHLSKRILRFSPKQAIVGSESAWTAGAHRQPRSSRCPSDLPAAGGGRSRFAAGPWTVARTSLNVLLEQMAASAFGFGRRRQARTTGGARRQLIPKAVPIGPGRTAISLDLRDRACSGSRGGKNFAARSGQAGDRAVPNDSGIPSVTFRKVAHSTVLKTSRPRTARSRDRGFGVARLPRGDRLILPCS